MKKTIQLRIDEFNKQEEETKREEEQQKLKLNVRIQEEQSQSKKIQAAPRKIPKIKQKIVKAKVDSGGQDRIKKLNLQLEKIKIRKLEAAIQEEQQRQAYQKEWKEYSEASKLYRTIQSAEQKQQQTEAFQTKWNDHLQRTKKMVKETKIQRQWKENEQWMLDNYQTHFVYDEFGFPFLKQRHV